jgi:hypothetical protein
MTKQGEQIKTILSNDSKENIEAMFAKTDVNKEFEFILFGRNNRINREKYIMVLKLMKAMSKNGGKIENIDSFEAIFSVGEKKYRFSSMGTLAKKNIARLQNLQNRNHLIYRFLFQTAKTRGMTDKNILNQYNFMLKKKEEVYDVEELPIRVKLSTEINMNDYILGKENENSEKALDNLLENKMSREEVLYANKSISFRMKERISYIVEDNDEYRISIDLTSTKTTQNYVFLNKIHPSYELEVEYTVKKSIKNNKSTMDTIYNIIEKLFKQIQQSSFLISLPTEQKIRKYYGEKMGLSDNFNKLSSRPTTSLEIQHTTEIIPNKYAVTDKADGDRFHMIIHEGKVYIISDTLNVRNTGIILDKNLEKYDGTVLDGENIYLPSHRRHLFMVFDCLRMGEIDMRSETKLMERLKSADEVINNCFVKGEKFEFKEVPEYKGGFNVERVTNFYGTEMSKYYKWLNYDIPNDKLYLLVRRKFFMPVFGAKKWEIFSYSVEMWRRYSEDKGTDIPYLLDGLIYQPLESKNLDYKWKPPSKNSIDFYIEFKKDNVTKEIINVYDNSESETYDSNDEITGTVRNKTYRICTLYVGKSINNIEQPVPFELNYGTSEAYLYLQDGEVRDENGNPLLDKTVAEFSYNKDSNMPPQRRWGLIRTRFDKTESVEKYKKKYGNYITFAEKIWRSIINPVQMSDFIELSKGNTDNKNYYDAKIREMNKLISDKLIAITTKEDKYYQKRKKMVNNMTQYHNFIKSNLVYTYCNKMYNSNKQLSVLDMACGRGGDISRFYYTEVAYYVGLDIASDGIKSPVDGALSRYNNLRKRKPNVPKMYFIQADLRAPLEYEQQVRALSGMDDGNKRLLEKFFPSGEKKALFDRINCQFAIHYVLKDDLSWDNFKKNVSNHLRNGGYFIATTWDAQRVVEKLRGKDNYSVHYDEPNGSKILLFDIKKKYSEEKMNRNKNGHISTGNAIDLFATWMFDDGDYYTEYLVDINFLIEEFDKDCDMELIDTDMFGNQFEINKSFILNAASYESSLDTREYINGKVSPYYEDTDINKKSMEYTSLTRYFIFRKRENKNKQTGGSTKEKNKEDTNEYFDFSNQKKFIVPDMNGYNDRYSLLNSVHLILNHHELIPNSIGVVEFLENMNIEMKDDVEMSNEEIRNFKNNIIFNHSIVNSKGKVKKTVNVLNGIDIYVAERDCMDNYDVEYWKDNSKKSIILMKEGKLYKPIFRCANNDDTGSESYEGIFDSSDQIIDAMSKFGTKN